MRYEFFGGLGVTNFMGELGGSDDPTKLEASHFLGDFDFSMTRPAFVIGMRYQVLTRLAATYTIAYGRLRGDDTKTESRYRKYRNASFRAPLWETGVRFEYSLITTRKGHRYSLRNVRGRAGNKIDLAIFGGIAAIFFNPRGEYGGEWFSLQPLGTEGQNYAKTRDRYSRFSMAIPMGLNMKYVINKKWSIGLEYGFRYTMSDYLDDVSTSYADPALVLAEVDGNDKEKAAAAYFANPSLGFKKAKELWGEEIAKDLVDGTMPNQQRGNSNINDIYMFTLVTVNYKVKTGRNGMPRF